jgi:Holliday junction resolvasome RuvABC endonuclease subunit
LAEAAQHFFGHYAPCTVYVEEAPMGRGFRASLEVGYVVGATIVEAIRAGHVVTPVNVSTWKKQTTGAGNADKDLVREWATRYVFAPAGVEPPKEQDLYDAACIAAFARRNVTQITG